MELVSLIICVMFTITSSAPIGYNSKHITEMENIFNEDYDTPTQSTSDFRIHYYRPAMDSENKARMIDYSMSCDRFQSSIIPNFYNTGRPVVAKADASDQNSNRSDQPLRWTLPSGVRRWFVSILSLNDVISLSVTPSLANFGDEATEKSSFDNSRENIDVTGEIMIAILPEPINSNDYVAISIFDNCGHIVRRMVPKKLIETNTVTTLGSARRFDVVKKIANVWQKHTL